MEAWIPWIIQTLTMLGVGVIGFLLKQFITQIRNDIKKHTDRIDGLEDKLNATIQSLPYNYVLREDFIRAQANVDKKLDKIIDQIAGIKQQ